ncbi:hypothetical protein ACIQMP_08015 [Streptomyces sp. NPDC091385]|uniref:hypothetical protein n=1 Tax=Streptomyces sp. NPDC091385 TaxID=3365997 RepID=UPI003829AAD5
MTPALCPLPPKPAPATSTGEEITADQARLVLQHFGHRAPGRPDRSSTWNGRLVTLIAEADAANRIPLARAYPGLVAAVQLVRTSPTGIRTLHAIAAY